jgi:vancomycin resistance protein YoaR
MDNDDVAALEGFEGEPEKKGAGTKVAIWLTVVVAVLALGYVGTAWYLQDKIPNNTSVAGVGIGGLPVPVAEERLQDELGPLNTDPLQIALGDRTATIDPAAAGLAFDPEATVATLASFSLDPRVLWAHLQGAGEIDPVSSVDEPALRSLLEGLRPELEVQPVEGAISFVDGAAEVTDPADGVGLDTEAAVPVVVGSWLTEPEPIVLPSLTLEPEIGQEEVDDAVREIVEPLTSGPVTVTVGDLNTPLEVTDLTAAAVVEPVDGELALRLDGETLHDRLIELEPDLAADGTDARIVIQNGAPAVIPSQVGTELDIEELETAVAAAAVSETRSATVSRVEAAADFTTEDARALGVEQEVSVFSTPLTSDDVRTQNLINGTRIITNTLVKPGETFSLIEALGPITAARGFVESGVVENGFYSKALGGGLSQLSTTTYNAAYFAGMDLVEHKPHSRWFSRYPEGREATMWVPTVDMKFRNPTPYGVLVQAWVEGGRVWVRFWSTPYFEVRTETSDRYNITQPQTVYNSDPECLPESGGQVGFTVRVTRWRYLDGALHDQESWTWTYAPWNRVECGTAP